MKMPLSDSMKGTEVDRRTELGCLENSACCEEQTIESRGACVERGLCCLIRRESLAPVRTSSGKMEILVLCSSHCLQYCGN